MSVKLRLNFKKWGSREKGSSLLEAVIALAVLGIAAIVILSALVTGTKATYTAWEQATAESLSRSEIEYIKSSVYDTTYGVDDKIDKPLGWEILEPTVEQVEDSLQKITVTIECNGRSILSVVTYKGEQG